MYVKVRIDAMRASSVSMSPRSSSISATLAAIQSSSRTPAGRDSCAKISARSATCDSSRSLRKSGIRQTSQSSPTASSPRARADYRILGEPLERGRVLGALDEPEAARSGPLPERGEERVDRARIEVMAPEEEAAHRGEAVSLDGRRDAAREREGSDRAEGAVAQVAPGAARDLRELRG